MCSWIFELRGCPINKDQLLELVTALLIGRKPDIPTHSLCVECKAPGISLRTGFQGGTLAWVPLRKRDAVPCARVLAGPATDVSAPWSNPIFFSLANRFEALGFAPRDISRMLRTFNGYLEPFKQASDYYEPTAKP